MIIHEGLVKILLYVCMYVCMYTSWYNIKILVDIEVTILLNSDGITASVFENMVNRLLFSNNRLTRSVMVIQKMSYLLLKFINFITDIYFQMNHRLTLI